MNFETRQSPYKEIVGSDIALRKKAEKLSKKKKKKSKKKDK